MKRKMMKTQLQKVGAAGIAEAITIVVTYVQTHTLKDHKNTWIALTIQLENVKAKVLRVSVCFFLRLFVCL